MRGDEEYDSTLGVQRGEWVEQRDLSQIIRWALGRGQLLRRGMRLQLTSEGTPAQC
ncbi:MAG TPA: hypothetical protein VIX11_01710 [Candidatus Acidoferrum sp.]